MANEILESFRRVQLNEDGSKSEDTLSQSSTKYQTTDDVSTYRKKRTKEQCNPLNKSNAAKFNKKVKEGNNMSGNWFLAKGFERPQITEQSTLEYLKIGMKSTQPKSTNQYVKAGK